MRRGRGRAFFVGGDSVACRGVYFALTQDEEQRLLQCGDDDSVLSLIQEDIEARWDADHLLELDKAWDAIHRCLTDGELNHMESREARD